MTGAIVLFAHGARDPRWAEPFEAIAARMRATRPTQRVEIAFLELMTPGLDEAVRRVVADGATRVDVVPLFLGTGGHVRNELPPLLARLAAEHSGVALRLHPAIGENATVIDAIAGAALALAGFGE